MLQILFVYIIPFIQSRIHEGISFEAAVELSAL